MKEAKNPTRKWRGLVCVCAGMLAFSFGVGSICETWKDTLDLQLGTISSIIVTEENGENRYTFTSDFANTTELVSAHIDLSERILEEGTVLLKNETDALPLGSNAKITLLGMRSQYPQYGGQIGSSPTASQNVSLVEALQQKGFEVNPTMVEVYETIGNTVTGTSQNARTGATEDVFGYQPGRLANSFGVSNDINGLTINEPAVTQYEQAVSGYAGSFASYSDAAIVVVGRPSSEAASYFPGEDGMAEDEGATDILGLTTNERQVLALAKENFDTVIVLVNSSSTMEIDELKYDEGIDSILWIGNPSNYGFYGIADVISGAVSPSGHLPDTYAVQNANSPAAQNVGMIPYANQDEIGTTDLTYADYRAGWYLVEAEGIYVGYTYYETRYEDTVLGQGNATSSTGASEASGWSYPTEVSYSFGYGLSYTSFSQTIDSVTMSDDGRTATIVATVTNTGSTSGKDVVQVYAQSPYTDYDRQNLVEKSSVQLLNFEKTAELAPGASETVTVEVELQYLASYDYTTAQTYIMDAGDYYFALGNGAHDALNNILAAKGYTTENGMDYDGNADLTYTWHQAALDTTTFATSKAGVEITNQLEDADLNYWLEDTVTYLTRNDWEGTFPITYTGITANDEMITQLRNATYEWNTGEDGASYFPEEDNDVSFINMKGADFDDERWELLLNQLSLEEAIYNIAAGGYTMPAMESIDFFDTYANDGPIGFSDSSFGARSTDTSSPTYMAPDDENYDYMVNDMPTQPIIAATFNKDMAYELGELFGNDALWNVTSVIWAPGMNLHRSPYNARNHEYYSEDAMLANQMGTSIVQGGLSKGLIMAQKHFAFNDQETNRVGVSPYMNEQTARERELRAFQGPFENGALGTMTAFNRIGATFVSHHVGLNQGILRGEWDFKGYVVSDMVNGPNYMTLAECVVLGTVNQMDSNSDTNLSGAWSNFNADAIRGDATVAAAFRENIHYLLYAIAQSNAMNGLNSSSYVQNQMTWWRTTYYSMQIGFGVLTALSLAGYAVATLKKKKGA